MTIVKDFITIPGMFTKIKTLYPDNTIITTDSVASLLDNEFIRAYGKKVIDEFIPDNYTDSETNTINSEGLAYMANVYYNNYWDTLTHLSQLFISEYNPLTPYNMETVTNIEDTEENTNTDSMVRDNSIYAFDSVSAQDNEKTTESTNTSRLKEGTKDKTETKIGNIGNTLQSQIIDHEISTWTKIDLFRYMLVLANNQFCIQVYK